MNGELNRRTFLLRAGTGLGAAWASAHWPAIVAAAAHAHEAAKSSTPPKFEFLSPAQATEIEAIAARIIPTDDTPGAREAGVVYFIDRALTTFSKDDQKTYQEGLAAVEAKMRKIFPGVEKFSAATPQQQDEVLHSIEEQHFFQTIRGHTITGFLIDPDSGNNLGGAGWKVIGREREHVFQPPFGEYDKDYPGWEPMRKDADKK